MFLFLYVSRDLPAAEVFVTSGASRKWGLPLNGIQSNIKLVEKALSVPKTSK